MKFDLYKDKEDNLCIKNSNSKFLEYVQDISEFCKLPEKSIYQLIRSEPITEELPELEKIDEGYIETYIGIDWNYISPKFVEYLKEEFNNVAGDMKKSYMFFMKYHDYIQTILKEEENA